MINILAVGAGGFIGAILRYVLGLFSKQLMWGANFPIGTFLANIFGAFFIGMAFQIFTKQGEMGSAFQLFLMVGVLGGFTTFSSFSLETLNFIGEGRFIQAALYATGSVIICLFGVWLGKSIFS